MAEKRYTEYIIDGIIDGMTDAKQTRPDVDVLKQRLYELSAIEKERLTKILDGVKPEKGKKMDDTISRRAAIDAVGKVPDYGDGMVFEALSHAQRDVALLPPAQQWIPCSERLPDEDDVYLVTIHPNYVPQECKQVDCMYYFKGEWWWLNEKTEWEKWPDPIIAWMSLPEPYEVERKEE